MFSHLPPVVHLRQSHDLRAGEPGRFVLVNDDDDDQDGILDHEDGYNKNGDPDPNTLDDDDRTYKDADHKEDDFVMLKVKIAPTSINLDPNKAWVKIEYSAASPDPAVPMSGKIRLWKRPGDEPRDRRSALTTGQGDWIAPGEYTDLKRLMPWDPNLQPNPGNPPATHEMTFYIEGVQTSQALGDVKITFKLDPDGEGPAPYVHMDTVQVTVVDINIETNSDNSTDGDIDAYDNMIEDEFPGRAMWPNVDNDNHATDDHADLEENGQVLGENDLAEIHVDVLPEIPGLMVKLEASPANLVKVWLQADKTTQAPMEWNAENLPYTLWVEGLADPGTTTVTLSLVSSPGAKDSIKMTVFKVKTVEWAKYMDNRDLFDYADGGKVIFPEAITYSDQAVADRKYVVIEALIEPTAKDITVHFREWDVDDPFDQKYPTWPDVGQVDNNTSGPDNRGSHEFPAVFQTTRTFTDGSAKTLLVVSPRPGDNYAIGATTTPQLFVNRFPPYGGPPPNPPEVEALMPHGGDLANAAKVTKRLTVWRTLNLELDSMAWNEDLNGKVSNRNIDYTWADTPHPGESGAEINGWNPGASENGRYEGGKLTVNGGGTYEIIDHWDDTGFDTLYVLGDVTGDLNKSASFTDDDVPQLPRLADTGLMTEKFAPAYIVISINPTVTDRDAPFVENTEADTEAALAALCEPRMDRWTSPSYWTALILSCHQDLKAQDGDPDYIYHYHGPGNLKQGDSVWSLGGAAQGGLDSDDNIIAVFVETIRDAEAQEAYWATLGVTDPIWPQKEAKTVVHEVGHLFGLTHESNNLMDPYYKDPSAVFTGAQLVTIRSAPHIENP